VKSEPNDDFPLYVVNYEDTDINNTNQCNLSSQTTEESYVNINVDENIQQEELSGAGKYLPIV